MAAVIIIGCSVAAFSCLLLLAKRPLAASDAITATFMLMLVVPMLEKLVLAGTIVLPYFGGSIFYGSPLTFGPFLYLYARSILTPGSLSKPRSLLHFLPFLVSVGIFLVQAATRPGGPVDGQAPGVSFNPGFIVFDALIILSFVVYTAKIIIMLRAHGRIIPDDVGDQFRCEQVHLVENLIPYPRHGSAMASTSASRLSRLAGFSMATCGSSRNGTAFPCTAASDR